MRLVVSGIVEVSVDKIASWISVSIDDWTAESAIVASNAQEMTIRNIMLNIVSVGILILVKILIIHQFFLWDWGLKSKNIISNMQTDTCKIFPFDEHFSPLLCKTYHIQVEHTLSLSVDEPGFWEVGHTWQYSLLPHYPHLCLKRSKR